MTTYDEQHLTHPEYQRDKGESSDPPVGSGLGSAVPPLFLGIVVLIGSLRLGLGSPASPGPGMWPFLGSLILIPASASLFLRGGAVGIERITVDQIRRVGLAVTLLACFALLFIYWGFLPPILIILPLWLRLLAGESTKLSIIITLVAAVSLYLVFVIFLRVPIPFAHFPLRIG